MEKEVGRYMLGIGLSFFPGFRDNGIPISLQVINIWPDGLIRLPSTFTVLLPKKLTESWPIIGASRNGPPMGIWKKMMMIPDVSLLPLGTRFIFVVAPMKGT
jgi:hypothetical protein